MAVCGCGSPTPTPHATTRTPTTDGAAPTPCYRWAMTRRLYHDDAYLRRFDAEVVAVMSHAGRPAVVLDRTAFYPEAGGQLGDRGQLAGAAVIDTQETDGGAIVHVLEGAAPALGERVTGELDWARRR